ncbi:MAG: AraC family transcriptional regulator [Oscillospiraceae bacterium]|nr:AraC family transcriptional regulator [Oscillospiraceae bacterium]
MTESEHLSYWLKQLTVQNVDDVLLVSSQQGKTYSTTCRPNCGLSFCHAGRITYREGTRTVVSIPGYAMLLPPGAAYSLRGEAEGCFPVINFTGQSSGSFRSVSRIKLPRPEVFLSKFAYLYRLNLLPDSRLEQFTVLYDLLALLVGTLQRSQPALERALGGLLERVADPDLKTQDLARLSGWQVDYFRRQFTARYGMPPHQYLLALRLKQAAQKLVATSDPVAKVAAACGFTNPYHFSRAFRNCYGQPPLAYRRQKQLGF